MRNESLYNLAQENEIFVFLDYMPKAVMRAVRNKTLWTGQGRPPNDLYDILVSLSIQRYVGWSSRRSVGMIKALCSVAKLHVRVPSWRSLCRYRTNQFISPYVDTIIEQTTKPLQMLERDFSTDSSGVTTKTFSSWHSIIAKKHIRRRDHIMAHVTTSRLLNAAVAVNVDCKKGKDSVYMREHIEHVKRQFCINDWCGDGAYCSRKNCTAIEQAGGNPWFRPKKNATLRQDGSRAYKHMMLAYIIESEKAMKHYHKRSNSESTFSAKKRKFGNFVRSKNDVAKENEELLSWIGYNCSVLSRAKYEYRIALN
jgi:hypothetical protein